MYTLVVKDDNTIITSIKQRIVQRSKLCDMIHILIPHIYKGCDISDYDVTMRYELPISHEKHIVQLIREPELYKGDYLEYKIPVDTWLTHEAGIVKFTLTIADVSIPESRTTEQYVRKITGGEIEIAALEDWASCIADPLLETVDQRIIQLLAAQKQLTEIQTQIMEHHDNLIDDDNVSDTSTYSSKKIEEKFFDQTEIETTVDTIIDETVDKKISEQNEKQSITDEDINELFSNSDDNTEEDSSSTPDDNNNIVKKDVISDDDIDNLFK